VIEPQSQPVPERRQLSSTPPALEETLLLQSRGLRPTPHRVAVLAALRSVRSHPTAEQLHRLVVESDGAMSLATVYNTLQALCRAGLCHQVATTGQSARYDAGVHDHVHFRDAKSGRIVDVPETLSRRMLESISPEVLQEIGRLFNGSVESINIQVVGSLSDRAGKAAGSEQTDECSDIAAPAGESPKTDCDSSTR